VAAAAVSSALAEDAERPERPERRAPNKLADSQAETTETPRSARRNTFRINCNNSPI